MSLFNELKRRNVFRVGAAYAIVAWLLIQVVDTVFPRLGVPEWFVSAIMLLLILGFPLALVLAWVFEFTPEGIKSQPAVDDANYQPSTGNKLNGVIIGVLLLTVIFMSANNYLLDERVEASPQSAQLTSEENEIADTAIDNLDKSIAVLPFNAFSTDPNEQYFADGLSDTLLNKLAHLGDLKVISRTSSFQYRGEALDVREIGNALGVATLLEGSVQRSGERLRIIAQLINTADGSHLWSETYDRDSADIFAIHDEISEAVVQALHLTISPEERRLVTARSTASVEAYNRVMQLYGESQRESMFELSPDELLEQSNLILDELDKVLEIDPDYAQVYRNKAAIYGDLLFRGAGSLTDYFEAQMRDNVLTAMNLEPDNPYNLNWYAEMLRRSGDPVSAETFARMTLAKLPNDSLSILILMLSLVEQGKQPDEQLALVERERELRPARTDTLSERRMTFALSQLGRSEEALAFRLSLSFAPGGPQLNANDIRIILSHFLGRQTEAVAYLIQQRQGFVDVSGNIFTDTWVTQMTILGLADEIARINLTLEPDQRYPAYMLFTQPADFRAYRAENLDDNAISPSINRVCLQLQDYACVIQQVLNYNSMLDSRNMRKPRIITQTDFTQGNPAGLRLAGNWRIRRSRHSLFCPAGLLS